MSTRVREVDGAALAVGEPAVVEQLQQHVEHVGVRLLDLVEQHDRVRPAAHRLGELAALLVADVARRRADQARHVVLLLVLRHVDAHHGALVVEQEVGERRARARSCRRRSGRGTGTSRSAGSGRTARRATRRIALATAVTASSWPITRSCSTLLHADELRHLALHEPAHRDAGPLRDDLGDVLLVDLLLQHLLLALELVEPLGAHCDLGVELAHACRSAARAARSRSPSRSACSASLRALLELLLELADLGDGVLLVLPVRDHRVALLGELGELLLERGEALLRRLVGLLRRARPSRSRAGGCAARPRRSRTASSRSRCAGRDAASSTRSIALSGS